MTSFHPQCQDPFQRSNDAADWSSLYEDVFNQYVNPSEVFGSDDLFRSSSEQSSWTKAGSSTCDFPPQYVRAASIEAEQPKAMEPSKFWERTVSSLERSAGQHESQQQQQQQRLRTVKSQPNFSTNAISRPPPPPLPASPTEDLLLVQGQSSKSVREGRKRNAALRSVSRGRSTGISKANAAAATSPYATVRRRRASPSKVITNKMRQDPGFEDMWEVMPLTDPFIPRTAIPSAAQNSPIVTALPLCDPQIPLVPPKVRQIYDYDVSPLTSNFERTNINSTTHYSDAILGSPQLNSRSRFAISLAHSNQIYRNVPFDDQLPHGARTAPLSQSEFDSFNFGFSRSPSQAAYTVPLYLDPPMHGTGDTQVLIDDSYYEVHHEPLSPRLACSQDGRHYYCDSSMTAIHIPAPLEIPKTPEMSHHTLEDHLRPRVRGISVPPARLRSISPLRSSSPGAPATEPRRRRKVTSRSMSRHKSTNSNTTNHDLSKNLKTQQIPAPKFVNFTPDDGFKLLDGVAPSGSSKTKARREKEAEEKQRRLSQAAVRAIVEAGGDLDSLANTGLLI